MKYIAFFFILTLFACVSQAQIIFTSDELIGSFNQQSNQTNFVPVNLGGLQALIDKSGPMQTWDFTGIQWQIDPSANSITSTFLPYPSGAVAANYFPTATHVMKNFDPADLTTYYDFWKINQTGFWVLGESEDFDGQLQDIHYEFNPPLEQLQLPLTYQTSWSDTSVVSYPHFPSQKVSEKIEAFVDGYGRLILPGSTSDCLRLRLKMAVTSSGGEKGAFELTEYSFLWVTTNGIMAAIVADSSLTATSKSSPDNPNPQVTRIVAKSANFVLSDLSSFDIRLLQNPAVSSTQLFYSVKKEGDVRIALMDALGKEVHMLFNGRALAGQNQIPIDGSKLSPGVYFIRLNTDGVSAKQKLIITR